MRFRLLFFVIIFSLFSTVTYAENWILSYDSKEISVHTDTDAIVPVALPNNTIVPNMYVLKDKATFSDDKILLLTSLVDIQSKKVLLISTDGSKNIPSAVMGSFFNQLNNWSSAEARSSITYFSYLYQNKKVIDSRPPYKLSGKQLDFGNRPSTPDGWQSAYKLDAQQLSGKIYTPSIQLYSNGKNKHPTIRFLAIIAYPSSSSTKESLLLETLVLCEINPNQPQQHLLTYVGFKAPDFSGWKTVGALQKSTYTPFAGDSPAAFLGSAALEYLLTHEKEVLSHGTFRPAINEKSAEEWIQFAGLKRYQQ